MFLTLPFPSLVSKGVIFSGLDPLVSIMAADLYSPPSPLGDSLLSSPLCGDLIEDLPDISQSIGDDSLGFDFPECQSADSGSRSSISFGEFKRKPWRPFGLFVHHDTFSLPICTRTEFSVRKTHFKNRFCRIRLNVIHGA